MTTLLHEETIAAFRRDGAVPIRGVFADWVETLRRGVDANMANPSPTARVYVGANGGGRFLNDYCNWDRNDDYRAFIFDSPAARVGAELMGSRSVQLFHEHVLVKEAKAGVKTPWHQDLPYYCIRCPQTVSLWIPLDDVPLERTLEFVARSHLWGRLYRPQRFNGQPLNADDGLDEIPDIDAARDDYDILAWALAPGDALAFDYRTIHGAPANDSPGEQRRAFSLRLLGDDAVFARRPGIVTSPPFAEVGLPDGAPLEDPAFPRLM